VYSLSSGKKISRRQNSTENEEKLQETHVILHTKDLGQIIRMKSSLRNHQRKNYNNKSRNKNKSKKASRKSKNFKKKKYWALQSIMERRLMIILAEAIFSLRQT